MWNRRIIILTIMVIVNIFAFGETKMKNIEELKIGTLRSEIYKEFGEPDSYFDLNTNLLGIIYKKSDAEYYKLYFRLTNKLWKLTKVINDEEYIIFMDIRID